MWIAILDYTSPEVAVIETNLYDDEDIQELLVEKGFSLDNINYITMDTLRLNINSL